MKKTIIIMSFAVVALAALAMLQGGTAFVMQGVLAGAFMLWSVLPLLVAAFALSGLVQVLINPEQVGRILGKGSGVKGILLGSVAGGLLPGGPYVYFPIAASFAACGAEAPTIMAFVIAKSLWDLSRIPMEVAIMGGRVAAIRLLVTFPLPVIIGLLTHWLYPNLTETLLPVKKEGETEC
ncbi:MAG: permease [Clostridiales bacterium]|jgi:uncharacterized membrane protein YraQ (UPF0718 family)|nr:permease [Clostridiales bacterium]